MPPLDSTYLPILHLSLFLSAFHIAISHNIVSYSHCITSLFLYISDLKLGLYDAAHLDPSRSE